MKACPESGVQYLLLVKPQFELDSHQIPEGGVVHRDQGDRMEAVRRVEQNLRDLGVADVQVKIVDWPVVLEIERSLFTLKSSSFYDDSKLMKKEENLITQLYAGLLACLYMKISIDTISARRRNHFPRYW